MKKSLVVASTVVAGVALAYPASSWLLGKQVEAALEEAYRPLADYPDVRILKREYERGIFGATERVTVELFGDTVRAFEKMQKDAAASGGAAMPPPFSKPVVFSMRSTIQHGPLAGGSTPAAAIIESELVAEGEALAEVVKTMGGQNPLQSRTVIDFTGGGVSDIRSPAFKTAIPGKDGGTPGRMEWDGISMKVAFTRGMKSYTLDGGAPRLAFRDAEGAEAVMTGFRLQGEQQRIFDDEPLLYSGKIRFALGELKTPAGKQGGDPLTIRQVAYEIDVPVQGEFVDLVARIGAEVVQVGEQNYGPAHYDFSLKHLHARTLARLYRAWMKMSKDPAALAAAGRPGGSAAFAPLVEPGIELLKHNPEIRIDRVSFRSKHGEASFSAQARLKDPKTEEFSNPLMLLMRLEAGAEASLPEALAGDLMGGRAAGEDAELRRQMAEMQLAAFEQQGYLRREGGVLKSRLQFANGQMTLNGQPFNPFAMGR